MLMYENHNSSAAMLPGNIASLEKMASVGKLAAGIAHDMNNLLAAIIGNADLLVQDEQQNISSFTSQKRINSILSAASKCSQLLSNLLSYSKQKETTEVSDLHELVTSAADLIYPLLNQSNIKIKYEFSATQTVIDCKKTQFANVLINLFLNARDAMPLGGVISVSTNNLDIEELFSNRYGFSISAGSYILISITDSGLGMSETQLNRLFSPFCTTKTSGTGLGLVNVHTIITDHKGLVDVESTEGTGTSFKLILPTTTKELDSSLSSCKQEGVCR